jgi:hypothetical protein
MMVTVDEARQQDLLAVADHRHRRMLAVQIVIGSHRDDDAVLLQHGAVVDLVPLEAVFRAGDGGAAADQTRGHDVLLKRRKRFLFGKGPIDLVAQQLGEPDAHGFRLARE